MCSGQAVVYEKLLMSMDERELLESMNSDDTATTLADYDEIMGGVDLDYVILDYDITIDLIEDYMKARAALINDNTHPKVLGPIIAGYLDYYNIIFDFGGLTPHQVDMSIDYLKSIYEGDDRNNYCKALDAYYDARY